MNSEKQYRALMTELGREDTLDDPRFADWFARQENEPALRAVIEEALSTKVLASGKKSSRLPARLAPASGRSRRSSTTRR